MEEVAQLSRVAAHSLAKLSGEEKNDVLRRMKSELLQRREEILAANREDLADAEKEVAAGRMAPSMAKRLGLEGKSRRAAGFKAERSC